MCSFLEHPDEDKVLGSDPVQLLTLKGNLFEKLLNKILNPAKDILSSWANS